MQDKEKILWMFTQVHGEITGKCYIQIEEDDGNVIGISVMKDNNLCWTRTKVDLIFEYLTKHLDGE